MRFKRSGENMTRIFLVFNITNWEEEKIQLLKQLLRRAEGDVDFDIKTIEDRVYLYCFSL